MTPTYESTTTPSAAPPLGGLFSGGLFPTRRKAAQRGAILVGLLTALANFATAADGRLEVGKLAGQLRDLPGSVLPEEQRESAAHTITDDLERRLRAADRRSTDEWEAIKTRDDWQRFRDDKLRRLREAIGPLPEEPGDLRLQVTGTVEGDGFRIKKVVFQSRPGLWVTANLYVPAEPAEAMPGLWGDSFAKLNPAERDFQVPRDVDDRPRWSEPLGGLLALLGALYEDHICAVYVRGGLSDFQCVLAHQFVYVPHDVVIPDLLTTGDLPDLAAPVAPRPLRLDNLVDGFNRLRSADDVRTIYQPAVRSYQDAGSADKLVIQETTDQASRWLLDELRGPLVGSANRTQEALPGFAELQD